MPSKNCDFSNFCDFSKNCENWKNRSFCENELRLKDARQKLRFLRKLRKIGEIAVFAKISK